MVLHWCAINIHGSQVLSCLGATKKLLKQVATEYKIHVEEATVVFPVQSDDEV